MNEWLKISINDFQNKRNLLYNSLDMFRNDDYRMEMFSNFEFQVVYPCFLIFKQIRDYGTIFYDPKQKEGEIQHVGDIVGTYFIILVVFHLFKYIMVFIFSSSRSQDNKIEDQLKKQAEMELNYENHFTQFLLEAHYKQRTESAKQKASKLLKQRTEKRIKELNLKNSSEVSSQDWDIRYIMLTFMYPLMQGMTILIPIVGLYISL